MLSNDGKMQSSFGGFAAKQHRQMSVPAEQSSRQCRNQMSVPAEKYKMANLQSTDQLKIFSQSHNQNVI